MKLRSFSAALAAAMLWAGAAVAEPASYTVVEADATIPFGSRINQLDRPERDTFLVRTGGDTWYRIQIAEGCARGSMIGAPVRLESQGSGGPIDRFAWVRLEDRSCTIQSLDRVELNAN